MTIMHEKTGTDGDIHQRIWRNRQSAHRVGQERTL